MRRCDNCHQWLPGVRTGKQRALSFCNRMCKEDYYARGVHMTPTGREVLRFLVEDRNGGPVSLEYNSTVNSFANVRFLPLLDILIEDQKKRRCIVKITDEGKRWYDFHFKK